MEDSKIIDLYWERNEKAISATGKSMEATVTISLITSFTTKRMRMKVSMIHTSAHGTLYRRTVRIC